MPKVMGTAIMAFILRERSSVEGVLFEERRKGVEGIMALLLVVEVRYLSVGMGE